MDNRVRIRLLLLVLAAGVAGVAIAWLILGWQRQSRDLSLRLARVDQESGQIASEFKDSLREMNDTRLQYAIDQDPATEEQFLKTSRQLGEWLRGQSSRLTSEEEKDILRQLDAAYGAYLQASGAVAPESAAPSRREDPLAAFLRARAESQRLFDLGESLARAHYVSRNRLLAEAGQHLQGLRRTVLALLALLFVFGIVLAAVAYRDLIAPLRMKLVQSQELAERHEKLASLGLLAAGVAHEIRNPLTAIKAALFIQQKRFAPGSPDHADAGVVQRELTRLERIVSDFLRFARPSDPKLATLASDGLLEDARQTLAPALAKAAIRLVREPGGSWPVRADSEQMKQVLINLIQNGADSMHGAGTVTLRSRRERRRLAGQETEVVILEVADTGRGIPPEVAKRLFDPFFTTKEHGTGLGLSIAARIVEKHGGALQYQTQVNRGTTFGIVLPLAQS
ncbi:MAG TPA: ATP-binding protein [Opitutaceae bacterium]|jgi:signal transduction histidine kinase|nr:ATP-binding protein [Opitutaceae bacterium]